VGTSERLASSNTNSQPGVAAGRLAKANPDLRILLVEGGKNNFNDPTVFSALPCLAGASLPS
jgi:hypothetical protein